MTDTEEKILLDMVAKNYVLFAPKGNDDLRKDYPELWDYPELKKLTPQEVMFIWWFACASSPIIEMPVEKRFPVAVSRAFKGSLVDDRKNKWCPSGQAPAFPDEIKAGIRRMEKFNPGLRIQMAVDNAYLFRECQAHIRQEKRISQEEREDYLKVAERARKIMTEIMKDTERGNFGVEEAENTTLSNLEGLSAAFHKSRM